MQATEHNNSQHLQQLQQLQPQQQHQQQVQQHLQGTLGRTGLHWQQQHSLHQQPPTTTPVTIAPSTRPPPPVKPRQVSVSSVFSSYLNDIHFNLSPFFDPPSSVDTHLNECRRNTPEAFLVEVKIKCKYDHSNQVESISMSFQTMISAKINSTTSFSNLLNLKEISVIVLVC